MTSTVQRGRVTLALASLVAIGLALLSLAAEPGAPARQSWWAGVLSAVHPLAMTGDAARATLTWATLLGVAAAAIAIGLSGVALELPHTRPVRSGLAVTELALWAFLLFQLIDGVVASYYVNLARLPQTWQSLLAWAPRASVGLAVLGCLATGVALLGARFRSISSIVVLILTPVLAGLVYLAQGRVLAAEGIPAVALAGLVLALLGARSRAVPRVDLASRLGRSG